MGTNAILATADDDGSFDGREIYDFGLAWNYARSGPTASNPLDVELEALAVVGVNNQVVLDRERARREGPAILARYQVAGDRSEDLVATAGDGRAVATSVAGQPPGYPPVP